MNQVALVGNLTDDPELHYTQSGHALASFTVAVSHRSKRNGEWQDVNDGFFRCTAWRSVAENATHTLKKGRRVFVAGKLMQRTVKADDATKRKTVDDPGQRLATTARHRGVEPPRILQRDAVRDPGCRGEPRRARGPPVPVRRGVGARR